MKTARPRIMLTFRERLWRRSALLGGGRVKIRSYLARQGRIMLVVEIEQGDMMAWAKAERMARKLCPDFSTFAEWRARHDQFEEMAA